MYDFKEIFGFNGENCIAKNVFTFEKMRISIITPYLVRWEVQDDGIFCDYPTQTVINRNFHNCNATMEQIGKEAIISTEAVKFHFKSNRLTCVETKDSRKITSFRHGNLKGTRRTLDMTFGKVKLGNGIISRSGATLMDDSASLLLLPDGTVRPRKDVLNKKTTGKDIYCFAYGYDYNTALKDYFNLTGHPPLIPRFAFGNWWSRYKAYTQDEYLALINRFRKENIPITVATVDMDWHYTDIKEKFGKKAVKCSSPRNIITRITGNYINPGWTGYTWNKELFPNYRDFLNELHKSNCKVTLNLHPAQGIRPYETGYREFAKFLGLKNNQPIPFDIADPRFIEGYFRFIHHPYEDDGVDFWWIDWQQESTTKIKGFDPLWALNHYHSLDLRRNGTKRALTLSRFAGNGSHRYPLGFSGDTGINFGTLKFQPFFTSTASNIGYTWWSHDIGGHHFGKKNDELFIRWVQFGVFSPVMRLHSSKNEFLGKEPWKYGDEANRIISEFMRLRHKLIPYIYSMNRKTSHDGIPLIKPMYYDFPEEKESYTVPNEYWFGSEIIVCPITSPKNKKTLQGKAEVWLPDGIYTDFFTGIKYIGGNKFNMYRYTNSIPVLAKEGAIIPLSNDENGNSTDNPKSFEIHIFSGNGCFTLYEDDGETENYKHGCFVETEFIVNSKSNELTFTVKPSAGDLSIIPKSRNYLLKFRNIDNANIDIGEKHYDGCLCVRVKDIDSDNGFAIRLTGIIDKNNYAKDELITDFISMIQGRNNLKPVKYSKYLSDKSVKRSNNPIKGKIYEIQNMK